MSQQFSEQEQIRRESLLALRNMGIEPYPAASFEISHSAATILKQFPEQPDSFKHVSLAGRVMGKRIMGKASFAVIQDSTSKIQIYVKGDEICPGEDKSLYEEVFKTFRYR